MVAGDVGYAWVGCAVGPVSRLSVEVVLELRGSAYHQWSVARDWILARARVVGDLQHAREVDHVDEGWVSAMATKRKLYEAQVTVRVVFAADDLTPRDELRDQAAGFAAKELVANRIMERVVIREIRKPSDVPAMWRHSFPWGARPLKTIREILAERKKQELKRGR